MGEGVVRIWGRHSFRSDIIAGNEIGRKLGEAIVARQRQMVRSRRQSGNGIRAEEMRVQSNFVSCRPAMARLSGGWP
jgi:hypothetical protein